MAPLKDSERQAPAKAAVTRSAPVKPTASQVIRRPALAAETAPVLLPAAPATPSRLHAAPWTKGPASSP